MFISFSHNLKPNCTKQYSDVDKSQTYLIVSDYPLCTLKKRCIYSLGKVFIGYKFYGSKQKNSLVCVYINIDRVIERERENMVKK